MATSGRLQSFDLLRLFFVVLALTSHYRLSQGTEYKLQSLPTVNDRGIMELPYMMALTRSSMSALLIVFGFMVEYVYANHWKEKGGAAVLERMLTRALVCYLAFASVSALAIMVQGGNMKLFMGTVLFAYFEHSNAFLFKYYTFLIPIVYLLMWVRFRAGLKWEILSVMGLIATAQVVKTFILGMHGPFELLMKNFFGMGNEVGPSVLHSLALVTFGSLAANCSKHKKMNRKAWLLLGIIVLSTVALFHEISSIGFGQFNIRMASTETYRAHNSYVYFSFGILNFLILWCICHFTVRQLGEKVKEWISYYGGNTFIIFLYGNILLLFVPKLGSEEPGYSIALITCLLLSLASVNIYDWCSRNFKAVAIYNRIIKLIVTRSLRVLFGSDRFEPRALM